MTARWDHATITGDPLKGCVWLGTADNHHMAVWYPGYWARFAPLRIYNGKGEQVWSELEARDLGGGWISHLTDRIPEQCRIPGERAFFVNPFERDL